MFGFLLANMHTRSHACLVCVCVYASIGAEYTHPDERLLSRHARSQAFVLGSIRQNASASLAAASPRPMRAEAKL